jgi:hypothetical protein
MSFNELENMGFEYFDWFYRRHVQTLNEIEQQNKNKN